MPDIRSIAHDVKQRVSALEMGRRMGLAPDRQGYCKCPFHSEKTGSLRLYAGDKGWWCYGCHQGGSVLDLVMKYYDLSLAQALIRIDTEMGLGLLLTEEENPQEKEKARQITEKQRLERERQKAAYEAALSDLFDAQAELVQVEQQISDLLPRDMQDSIKPGLPMLYRKRQELHERISQLEMEVIRE